MSNENIYRKWGIIAFLFVSILCVIAFFYLNTHRGDNQWNNYGEAAGIYTALGTFFTGLSFSAFIITLIMQHTELKLQREELILQREESKKSRIQFERHTKVFEETNKYNQKQEMRNMFTMLNENIQGSIERLSYKASNTARFSGYAAFTEIANDIYSGRDIANSNNIHGLEPTLNTITSCSKYIFELIEEGKFEINEYRMFSEILLSILTHDIKLVLIYSLGNIDNSSKSYFERIGILDFKKNVKNLTKIHNRLLSLHFKLSGNKIGRPHLLFNIIKLYPVEDFKKNICTQTTIDATKKIVQMFTNGEDFDGVQKHLASTIEKGFIEQECKNNNIDDDKTSELIKTIYGTQS